MGVFQPVTIEWGDHSFTIPADRMLRVIADVETKITFIELASLMDTPQKIPLALFAQVYGMVLRHAGATVTDEDCYALMFQQGAARDQVRNAMQTIMLMMMPPGLVEGGTASTSAPKKTAVSSNRRIRRSVAAKARG